MNKQNLDRFAEIIRADQRVSALILFGSRARGEAGPLSDVDLAALLAPDIAFPDFLSIRLELTAQASAALRSDRIELIVLNEAPPALAIRVGDEGQRLVVKDEQFLSCFFEHALDLYLDFEPYARAYDRALRARIKKGVFGA